MKLRSLFGGKTKEGDEGDGERKGERRPPPPPLEEGKEALSLLLAGLPYNKQAVSSVAVELNPQWKVLIAERVADWRSELAASWDRQLPLFAVLDRAVGQWAALCVARSPDGRPALLYKDCLGTDVPPEVSEALTEFLGPLEEIPHPGKEQSDVSTSGPLTLRNMKVMLQQMESNQDAFVESFAETKFYTEEMLDKEKIALVPKYVSEISGNAEFKEDLKQFIESLPLELILEVYEYQNTMQMNMQNGSDTNGQYMVNSREKIFSKIDEIKEKFESISQKDEKTQEVKMNLEIKYPEMSKKFTNIFQIIQAIKNKQVRETTLRIVSEQLDINREKMDAFSALQKKREEEKTEKDDAVKPLKPKSLEEVLSTLPEAPSGPAAAAAAAAAAAVTPLEQLLAEISLGMDPAEGEGAGAGADPEREQRLRQLEQQFRRVKQLGELWRDRTPEQLRQWADGGRGQLGDGEEAVCEAIAALDRANELVTGGHRLRDPQVLSLLAFLLAGRGRLCQVHTGEGKTTIVSVLAAARALQGHTVDVITSSPVLAAEGAEERAPFFDLLGVTVATNNREHAVAATGARPLPAYTAHVLYGTISNFQFDYLRDSFEGYGIRCGRAFGHVILDEVDSMLVDNGGHIAKLAAPFPGMEALRYVYINIWRELQKAEAEYLAQCAQTMMKKGEELGRLVEEGSLSEEEARGLYEKLQNELTENGRNVMKSRIRESRPTEVEILPKHLKQYADAKLEKWLKNAVYAKYRCHEFQQYRVMRGEDGGERFVAPVDYLNTGVTLRNTIWADGLHQFVQLKHNLRLTSETLTSCFVSNIGYIKKYPASNISGLTGTLGSRAEQELLAGIYDVDFAKIPTYKPKRFEELAGSAVPDSEWETAAALEAVDTAAAGRALLLICETQRDADAVKRNLETLQKLEPGCVGRVRSYASEEDAAASRERVQPGDAILATNLAGRGTNFKTDAALEAAGGLHVCVGFLPYNARVQAQAFGRTSRQGNSGTARLLARYSELRKLGLDPLSSEPLARATRARDAVERRRIAEIRRKLVPELAFKDALFERFSQLHRRLKDRWLGQQSYSYVLQDLKEVWAFWLERKDFEGTDLSEQRATAEYEVFEREASSIIQGSIKQNPYYSVSQADYFLRCGRRDDAEKALHHAIDICGSQHSQYLYGVYMQLFEIALEEGDQWRANLACLFKTVFTLSSNTPKYAYKDEAVGNLEKAKAALQREIGFMERRALGETSGLEWILAGCSKDDSDFLQHLSSRLLCLRAYEGLVDGLLSDTRNMAGGVVLAGKDRDYWRKMEADAPAFSAAAAAAAASELAGAGLSAAYGVRELPAPHLDMAAVGAGLGQIGAGIAVLAPAIFFPFLLPVLGAVAGFLIGEGTTDVILAFVKFVMGKSPDFDIAEFAKDKLISAAVSLLTWGISAIMSALKIVEKAIRLLQKMSSLLKASSHLQKVCRTIASAVDKLAKYLEKFTSKAKEVQKVANVWEQAKSLSKAYILKPVVSGVKTTLVKYIEGAIVSEILKGVKGQLKGIIKEGISNNQDLCNKLRTGDKESNIELSKECVDKQFHSEWYTRIAFGVLDGCHLGIVSLSKDIHTLRTCVGNVVHDLEKDLQAGDKDNDLEELKERISEELASKMYDNITQHVAGAADKLVKFGSQYFKKKPVEHIVPAERGEGQGEGPEAASLSEACALLGVQPDSSEREVRRAFRSLALRLHPDKRPGGGADDAGFGRYVEAYHLLLQHLPAPSQE